MYVFFYAKLVIPLQFVRVKNIRVSDNKQLLWVWSNIIFLFKKPLFLTLLNYRLGNLFHVRFDPYSAGIDFRRQNLTSVDV